MSDLPTGAIDSDDSGEFEVPTTAAPSLVAKSAYGYTNGNLTSIDDPNNNSDPALRTIDDFQWTYEDGPGLPDSDSAEPLSNTGDSLPLANAATIPGGSSLPAWEVSSFTSSVDGTATYNYDADAQLRGAIYTRARRPAKITRALRPTKATSMTTRAIATNVNGGKRAPLPLNRFPSSIVFRV